MHGSYTGSSIDAEVGAGVHCRYHGPIAGMAASQQLFLDASAHIKASDLIEARAWSLRNLPLRCHDCQASASCRARVAHERQATSDFVRD